MNHREELLVPNRVEGVVVLEEEPVLSQNGTAVLGSNHASNGGRVASIVDCESVPARFAHQVAAYPDRIAIQGEEQTLTYRQLDLLSNQIAHVLREGCA